ncbi:ATPase domain-containing protein [Halobacterium yunchengense]|uniref:ATPase domain-containing protein n=1 Tax=Halobacterium yunchengense TaxID=3108497 RepID=UPI00300911A1
MTGDRVSTGVDGLDEILSGGLVPERSYLVRGEPGTGKTILGVHFLADGVRNGETSLYVNLEECRADVEQNAASLGFDLDDVSFLDLSPTADVFADDQSYSVMAASDVEQPSFVETVTGTVEDVDPDRVFVDPITHLRHLTPDAHQFRKQAIGFMEYLTDHGATVLFTSQSTASVSDEDLQFLSDGTIDLGYGEMGHTVDVPKFRGSSVREGHHAMEISGDGVTVYPALRPEEHAGEFAADPLSSGVEELDYLLDGGIERGTVTVLSGPSGAGKTTVGTQFLREAATRGERSVTYLFEENAATFRERSEAIGIPVSEMEDRDTLVVEEMEPLNLSPQQFAARVRREVEDRGATMVMIDGTRGYEVALQGRPEDLTRRLHALCRYLKNVGVTVVLVDESSTLVGEFSATDSDTSYLADNIVLLRHIEYDSELRKIVGVLKKRTSDFERTLRELRITERGVEVGDPLTGLRGMLSGTPTWRADDRPPSRETE